MSETIKEYKIRPYKREYIDKSRLIRDFYILMSAFNNIMLTKRELDLITHISLYGGIASVTSKKIYLDTYHATIGSIDNIIMRLKRKKLLVKVDGKIRVNPAIDTDFSNDKHIITFKCQMKQPENE